MNKIFYRIPIHEDLIKSYDPNDYNKVTFLNGEKSALWVHDYQLFFILREVTKRSIVHMEQDVLKIAIQCVCTPLVEGYLNACTQMKLPLPYINVEWLSSTLFSDNLMYCEYNADDVVQMIKIILPLLKKEEIERLLGIISLHQIFLKNEKDFPDAKTLTKMRNTSDKCYHLILNKLNKCLIPHSN